MFSNDFSLPSFQTSLENIRLICALRRYNESRYLLELISKILFLTAKEIIDIWTRRCSNFYTNSIHLEIPARMQFVAIVFLYLF